MSKHYFLSAAAFLGMLSPVEVFAQNEELPLRSEASVQAIGTFGHQTNKDGVIQDSTNRGGVLASYRFFFTTKNGVEVNYGWFQNTQTYGLSTGSIGLPARSHEVTASYVFRYPMKRITPFFLAGAGALVFDPKVTSILSGSSATPINPTWQARPPAFLYGGGVDVRLTRRVFFRAGYRGLAHNTPNFDTSALSVDRVTHRAEPFGGLGFRF